MKRGRKNTHGDAGCRAVRVDFRFSNPIGGKKKWGGTGECPDRGKKNRRSRKKGQSVGRDQGEVAHDEADLKKDPVRSCCKSRRSCLGGDKRQGEKTVCRKAQIWGRREGGLLQRGTRHKQLNAIHKGEETAAAGKASRKIINKQGRRGKKESVRRTGSTPKLERDKKCADFGCRGVGNIEPFGKTAAQAKDQTGRVIDGKKGKLE